MPRKFFWVTISKRYLIAFGLLVAVIYLLTLPNNYHVAVLSTTVLNNEVKYDVVLDAGHGGIDSGGIGAGDVFEKDIVLDIILRMERYLSAVGLNVGLTRDSDIDVTHLASKRGTRHQRDLDGRFVALHQGNIGMSVHANVTKSPDEAGALVFYLKDSYIDELYANAVLNEIEKVQVLNYESAIGRTNLLLLKAKPSVLLVEVGFLSNPDDLAKLVNPEFRQVIAEALCKGILAFYNSYRGEQTE